MVSFYFSTANTLEFDFNSTVELMVEARDSGEGPYRLIEDHDQLQVVISEVTAKGLIPFSY